MMSLLITTSNRSIDASRSSRPVVTPGFRALAGASAHSTTRREEGAEKRRRRSRGRAGGREEERERRKEERTVPLSVVTVVI